MGHHHGPVGGEDGPRPVNVAPELHAGHVVRHHLPLVRHSLAAHHNDSFHDNDSDDGDGNTDNDRNDNNGDEDNNSC